jgi:hypothetical protein
MDGLRKVRFEQSAAALAAMAQHMVSKHAGEHCFTNGHGANADTWIVTAFGEDLRRLA